MPSSNRYENGAVVRLTCEVKDAAGAYADPGGLTFRYRDPNDAATTVLTYGVDAGLVKDAVGKYHVDLPGNVAGLWQYRFVATGVNAGADGGSYTVGVANV